MLEENEHAFGLPYFKMDIYIHTYIQKDTRTGKKARLGFPFSLLYFLALLLLLGERI